MEVMRETLFRRLIEENDWTTVQTFNVHFTKAARELADLTGERSLADVIVSRRSFDRWKRGELETLPWTDTRRVLEHLFGVPVVALFQPPRGADTSDEQQEAGAVQVALTAGTGTQLPSEGSISVPVRTNDGRITFVSLSRRGLLGALGVGVFSGATGTEAPAGAHAAGILSTPNPVEHLQATLRVLIDNDNLFGPHRVIAIAQQHLTAIRTLRKDRRGADLRRLLRLQTRYMELCGWLFQDMGDLRTAQHWMGMALEASHMADDREITVYILARRSQLAGDMREPHEAVAMAEAAEHMASSSSRLAAIAATYAAHGHALIGDASAAQRSYDHAHQLYEKMDPDPAALGPWLDASYIEAQRARSLACLGDHAQAAQQFHHAVQHLPPAYHRDRGVYLAREAVAHAHAGEPEHAAEVGLRALNIGVETGSDRIASELTVLDRRLARWSTVPAAAQFKDALNESVLTHV